jgi:hypothetical protein
MPNNSLGDPAAFSDIGDPEEQRKIDATERDERREFEVHSGSSVS